MAATYAMTLAWLSLARHAAHQTNALDLGYYSNTLWNTIHGSPFRFTTFHAADYAFPEFAPRLLRQPDNLLAYHVEPILLPLALIYLIWPDARALLVLQALVLASGALPLYAVASRTVGRPWLALAFPAMYLMSPSLIGANLSDFHPVTLSAPLVLWAFAMRERHAYRAYFVCVVLLLALKEEMGLLVAMLGLYQIGRSLMRLPLPLSRHGLSLAVQHERVRVGLLTLGLAALWTTGAILTQHEAAGTRAPLFAARYAWLGHSVPDVLRNALTTTALIDWVRRPEVNGYLAFLFAQVGFAALLAPDVLLMAAPEIAINGFSTFDWMRSGVAHYSAPIVPVLVLASLFGVKRAAHAIRRFLSLSWHPRTSSRGWSGLTLLTLLALGASAYQCYRSGQLPFTQDFMPFAPSTHDSQIAAIVARIPPNANVSAQSDLYPHLSERANVYLFPTISDAEYIVLDVNGQTYPLTASDYARTVQELVYETPLGILVADGGYLLLARNDGVHTDLPDAFFSFVRADARAIAHPLHERFGEDLEFIGYDVEILSPRQLSMPSATIRTYWRALRPLNVNLRFVFCFYAPAGYLRYVRGDSPTEFWYPTTQWHTNEVVVVEQRGVQVEHGGTVGVRVALGEPDAQTVLPPQSSERLIEADVVKLLDVP